MQDPHAYSPASYDEQMCLKPPVLLWLAALFLCRAVTLPLLIGIGHIAGVNADAMTQLRSLWSAELLLPASIAMPVLSALCWRSGTAPALLRRIWARGRTILTLSAAVDAVLPFLDYFRSSEFTDQQIVGWFAFAVDLYFLAYLLGARRVRDTFADFPASIAGRD